MTYIQDLSDLNIVVNTSITNGSITLAKLADVNSGTVYYRKTAGVGAPEVQTLATLKTDLGLTGINTGDQTIVLTGDVTGTGSGSFATTIAVDAIDIPMLSATGTADATTFLRGDNTWGVPGEVTLAGSLDYLTISGLTITRNAIDLDTDVTGFLALNKGGTGAVTTAGARQNLELELGIDVQEYSANLESLADLSLVHGDILFVNASGDMDKLGYGPAGYHLTTNGVNQDPTWSGPGVGTYQPLDATLTDLASLTTAADQMIYSLALDTFATTSLTPFARTLLDDLTATDMLTTLGVPDILVGGQTF